MASLTLGVRMLRSLVARQPTAAALPACAHKMPSRGIMATSVDAEEVAKFGRAAAEWWDPHGQFAMLHKMNPLRVRYIVDKVDEHVRSVRESPRGKPLDGLRMLDVGCGGGLLSESLSRLGGTVTGIDAAPENVKMAKLHADADPMLVTPTYINTTAEDLLAETGGSCFDVVCSLEVIEHVTDPAQFVATLCQLVKPQGVVLLSTINRTPKSYLFTIMMAEQVLRMVPPGTHDYNKYVTPDELTTFARHAGASIADIRGMFFNPITNAWELQPLELPQILLVNYLACLKLPETPETTAETPST
ncbi:hypothetical protein HDU96_001809 [Phlyctochytrium bullatum]|nr:hypothetical protein HDU96_001809 [Phlyctochytrium bullatum]